MKKRITIADQRRAAKKARLTENLVETAEAELVEALREQPHVPGPSVPLSEVWGETSPEPPPPPPPPPPSEPFDGLGAAIARALRSRRA